MDNELMLSDELIDITPSPRVLRVLGEIPFAPWQCIAELIDNAIDALAGGREDGASLDSRRVIVSWSSDSVPVSSRTLEVIDTGAGMTLSAIQESVRAGYSSNSPINNLGLFGMGFNIATARLGEKTTFLSATRESSEWVGIEIDFQALISSGGFRVPTVHLPKASVDEHGTKIIVSQLKPSICAELSKSSAEIRRVLAEVYSPILGAQDIEIMVQGVRLPIVRPCVWDAKRYVSIKGNETVPAITEIDELLGDAYFDTWRNRYLTPAEEDDLRQAVALGKGMPRSVVARSKRIHGWLGIQRYADPNDYGIDFIRNGRKIVRRDKSLFTYQNPVTGRDELEYPLELGTSVGGRIVGEIHIDHVPPTYQKADFDRSDPTWYEVVEVLRGSGPIRPNKRKLLDFLEPNTTLLARLVIGYEQIDSGTRHLFAPSQIAKQYAKKFMQGDPDFQSDEKWWEAALEADRSKADKGASSAPPVDPGRRSSDDAGAYLRTQSPPVGTSDPVPSSGTSQPRQQSASDTSAGQTNTVAATPAVAGQLTLIDEYKRRANRIVADSTEYAYPGCRAPFLVNVWELVQGKLGEGDEGEACKLIREGNRCDFFFNPRHPFLRDYPGSYRDLLLLALAERFKVRDNLSEIAPLYTGLWMEHFPDQRIDRGRIQEKASAFFFRLRERATELLALREQEALDCVHEALGEVEDTCLALISSPELLRKFQARDVGAINALSQVPARTLVRLVDRFPEEFLDGKYFNTPYQGIELSDEKSTERLRLEAKDRLLSFLKDALWVISDWSSIPARQRKAELARCGYSLSFLDQETGL